MSFKISDLSALGGTFKTTDLFEISVDDGGGGFDSYKITGQELLDGIPNLGNADLTASAATRKFILNGALSTDYFTIRDSSDTTDILKVQGDDIVRINKLGIGNTPSTSYPVRFTTTTAIAPLLLESSAGSGKGLTVSTTGGSSEGIRVTNTGTSQPHGLNVILNGNAGIKTGIEMDITGTATNNIGLDLSVSGGTNNYAIDFVAGDLKFSTGTGSKIGTATSQKIGFWNATPVVQPTTGITAGTFTANTSGISDDSATFDGYTIGQIAAALRQVGILA